MLSDQKIREMFHEVHNVFWRRWRERRLDVHDETSWEQASKEAEALNKKYGECDLICHMTADLLLELSERARSGPGKRG